MWTRVLLLTLILRSVPVFAQRAPDFSGAFLQDPIKSHANLIEAEDPLVLDIKQGADNLRVTEMQNGIQSTSVFNIRGKPTIHENAAGLTSKDRMKFKGAKLVIKSEVEGPGFVGIGRWQEETWKLSPDLQTLTIRLKEGTSGVGDRDSHPAVTYSRQASLAVALRKAASESVMNTCNAVPSILAEKLNLDPSHGVILGETGFWQLWWHVSFGAGLSGEFFHGLERTKTVGGVEFRKNGMLISRYSDSITLEVTPQITPRYWQWGSLNSLHPEWLQTLRFRIKWVGSETRDLGEVPSELNQEPLPELAPPHQWYQLEIPAQDVPISDSLEVHILSPVGSQLGCFSGHL